MLDSQERPYAELQNAERFKFSGNSMAAVLTENDIPGTVLLLFLERPKPANLEKEACPASTLWFGRHYEYGV